MEPASEMEVEVTFVPTLRNGDKLGGERADELRQANYIRQVHAPIGFARCCNKNKTVALYKDGNGQIWGTSTVKPERYFKLRKV